MFKIDIAHMQTHYDRFGAVIIIATNTNNTLWDNVLYNEQDYPGYYFVGLQILYQI